jgi:hypothetical protein
LSWLVEFALQSADFSWQFYNTWSLSLFVLVDSFKQQLAPNAAVIDHHCHHHRSGDGMMVMHEG